MSRTIERLRAAIPTVHGDEGFELPTCPCVACGKRVSLLADVARLDALYRAAKEWRRAEDDSSWNTEKDWHKRHDKGNARRALREAIERVDRP